MKLRVDNTLEYVTAISGLFISKDNPGGLTKQEIKIFSLLIEEMRKEQETKLSTNTRKILAKKLNYSFQVMTNYITKFKNKRLLNKDKSLHPIFTANTLTIFY